MSHLATLSNAWHHQQPHHHQHPHQHNHQHTQHPQQTTQQQHGNNNIHHTNNNGHVVIGGLTHSQSSPPPQSHQQQAQTITNSPMDGQQPRHGLTNNHPHRHLNPHTTSATASSVLPLTSSPLNIFPRSNVSPITTTATVLSTSTPPRTTSGVINSLAQG